MATCTGQQSTPKHIGQYTNQKSKQHCQTWEALRNPAAPIILMYAHEIGRIRGDPHVAEDTVPSVLSGIAPTGGTTGCVGRNGARCALLHGGGRGGAEVYPPAPDIQHYKTLVAKLSQLHYIVAEARQHNDIHSLSSTHPLQNVPTSHH